MYCLPRRLEIRAEKLIEAVKSRPPLYNKSDPNFVPLNKYKGKLWKEVCKEVFDNWDQLKIHEKVEYDYDLRKRWKNLRTAFARELANQKKEKEEGSTKLRKVYAHFDQMSFLINPDIVKVTDAESIKNSSNIEESDDDDDDESSEYQADLEEVGDIIVKPERLEIEGNYEAEEFNEATSSRSLGYQEKLLSALEDLKKGEEDEDKQFMMSLVPSLRKLNAKQKFTAKIAILNVLKDVTFQE